MANHDQQQQTVILNTFFGDARITLTTVTALSAITTKALMSYEEGDDMAPVIELNDLLGQSIILLSIQLQSEQQ